MGDSMKIKVGADISGLKKGMGEAEKVVKDLGGKIGGLTGPLGKIFDTAQQIGSKFVDLGAAAGKSTEAMAKLGTVGAAAGAGIAASFIAAKAAFEQLNALASRYESTIDGIASKQASIAFSDTFNASLMDAMGGEKAANRRQRRQAVKSTIRQGFWASLAGGGATDLDMQNSAWGTHYTEAADKAYEVEIITKRIVTAQNDLLANQKRIYEIDAQIAENKQVLYNKQNDLNERLNAGLRVEGLIAEKKQNQESLLYSIASGLNEINGKTLSSPEDLQKENAAWAAYYQVTQQSANSLRELLEPMTAVRKELQKIGDVSAMRAAVKELGDLPSVINSLIPQSAQTSNNGIEIKIKPVIDSSALATAQKTMLDLTGLLQGMATDVMSIFGNAIGNALSGENVDIGSELLKMVGSTMVKFGELAVACGIASSGIIAALELNPALAIGAGAALIALGAAVSAAASNIASGTGSTTVSNSASSYLNSSSAELSTMEVNVRVAGTLQASGSTLLAVINNENKRLNHTT